MRRLNNGQTLCCFFVSMVVITSGTHQASGDILVGNWFSGRVYQFAEDGSFVRDFVDENERLGPTLTGIIRHPDGSILIASLKNSYPGRDLILQYDATSSDLIREFSEVSSFTTYEGRTLLTDVVVGPDGDLYATLQRTSSIRRYDGITGAFVEEFTTGRILDEPNRLTFGPDGNLYVASRDNSVLRFDGVSGSFIDEFAFTGGLSIPSAIEFGPDGNLYVASTDTDDVARYSGTTGEFIDIFASGGGLDEAANLKFGPDGDLYVVSFLTHEIKRYDGLTGEYLGNAIDDERLMYPSDIEFIDGIPEPGTATMTLIAFVAIWSHSRRRRHSLSLTSV